jgi:NAD(P)-dependent dehydrogenase (short-subunit alcohol dehydrogenase family)
MPSRRAVLVCGHARATVAAVARALAAADLPLVIQAAPSEIAATRRLCRRMAGRASAARVVGAGLGGDAESRQLMEQAWRAARAIEAVVVCPAVAAADSDLIAWRDALDTGLRTPFFLAKHAGLRLGRSGGGRVVFAIGAPRRDAGAAAHVVRSGLRCMIDALGRALSARVAVSAVVGGGAGVREIADIARGVRFLVEGRACASGTVLELGGQLRSPAP